VLCDMRACLESQGVERAGVPPVFITQHLSAPFNEMLARRLSAACGLDCAEAVSGAPVLAGRVYVAPDGAHLAVQRGPPDTCRIRLMQTPPVHFCRPAADPMLESLAAAYGENLLAVILTGMGKDGLTGCQYVAAAGGTVWVQDAQSSVVWGMPGAVAQSGLPCRVLPLGAAGAALADWMLAGDMI
ncbi:MAG: CheB methylesterase domain-containing protein, partial [Alphaproteobacteria bacterium]|nr:CheB methylesterase domain-containing protein [Alphaproteobacteria bacterium]